ncbi:MAG: flagellar basal body-associated protein FliL [Bdellovibrionia bacterium]
MAEEAKKDEKPKNTGLILQIALAVVNLGVMGAGVYMVYASTLGWKPPVITETDLASQAQEALKNTPFESEPLIYTLDKFTVNLDGEPKRSVRIEVNLEMMGEDAFEEVMRPDNRAKARDRILRMLNEKNFTDLESIQGKLFLKNKIANEINSLLKDGVVKQVYFSDFVVQ